jgi:hypothetical protein
MVRGGEHVSADRGLGHHGLDEARPVPHDQEVDLAARAPVVQPPVDRDRLPLETSDVVNLHAHVMAPRSGETAAN